MKPEIGSKWTARDGRKFVVHSVQDAPRIVGDKPFAVLLLLNPQPTRRGRGRRHPVSCMGLHRFGKFLTPTPEEAKP